MTNGFDIYPKFECLDEELQVAITVGTKGSVGPAGPQGPAGETGNGIQNVVLNADYTLTIYFTNGTSWTSTSIRGERGERGIQSWFGTIAEYNALPSLDPDVVYYIEEPC